MRHDETALPDELDDAMKQRLAALLNTIVPADADGAMPGAGELDFPAYLAAQAPDFLPKLKQILDRFGDDFADRPLAERVSAVEAFSRTDAATFHDLVFRTYDCYYQDDRVRRRIGARPGSPFPNGHAIAEGDFSSLEAVKARGKGYRRP